MKYNTEHETLDVSWVYSLSVDCLDDVHWESQLCEGVQHALAAVRAALQVDHEDLVDVDRTVHRLLDVLLQEIGNFKRTALNCKQNTSMYSLIFTKV